MAKKVRTTRHIGVPLVGLRAYGLAPCLHSQCLSTLPSHPPPPDIKHGHTPANHTWGGGGHCQDGGGLVLGLGGPADGGGAELGGPARLSRPGGGIFIFYDLIIFGPGGGGEEE